MGADGPFGPIVNGTQIVFFEHRPSEGAGYAFLGLFGLMTLTHLVFMFGYRAWFCICLILGGAGEAGGYYGRGSASKDPNQKGPFILQFILLLVSAPFITATIYMSLGRIIVSLQATHHSPIPTRWMTKIYVLIDIGCIFTQFIGAGMVANGTGNPNKAKAILLIGLGVQVAALLFFIVTCWLIYVRLQREPSEFLVRSPSLRWKKFYWAIGAATIAMIARTTFRSIEFIQGQTANEVFIYVFDAVPMLFIMALLLVFHPGRLIRNATRSEKIGWHSEGHVLLNRS